jgi:hypothetical protein
MILPWFHFNEIGGEIPLILKKRMKSSLYIHSNFDESKKTSVRRMEYFFGFFLVLHVISRVFFVSIFFFNQD